MNRLTGKDVKFDLLRSVNFLPIDISKCILITLIPCILVNRYLRHNLSYKQKIQVIQCNQVYFSSSNVSTDTIVIGKD